MNHLKKLRQSRISHFSQHHLAMLAGIDQSRISLLERDLVAARPDEKRRLAKALGVPVEAIWPGEAEA